METNKHSPISGRSLKSAVQTNWPSAIVSLALAVCFLLAGCTSLNKTAITVSQVEDSLMKSWAKAHNDRLTNPALDAKVIAAHGKFLDAKALALAAYRGYEAGGDKTVAEQALAVLAATVPPLIDLLTPILSPAQTENARQTLSVATKP